MNKDQVAQILIEIGTLLELKGENPFKTRAYMNAARTLEGLNEPLEKIVSEERLGEIADLPGRGTLRMKPLEGELGVTGHLSPRARRRLEVRESARHVGRLVASGVLLDKGNSHVPGL